MNHLTQRLTSLQANQDSRYIDELGIKRGNRIEVPRTWIIDGQGETIKGILKDVDQPVYYRYYNDTNRISGVVEADKNGNFTLQVPTFTSKKEKGDIELWIDDPFGEPDAKNDLGSNYYIIKVQPEIYVEPLTINDKDSIDSLTKCISGKGDPDATIEVYRDGVKLNVTVTIESDGAWQFCYPFEENIGHTFTIRQAHPVGKSSMEEFVVTKHLWKQNEFMTAKQLFGDENYAYAFNVRDLGVPDDKPDNIESAIVINPVNQTYTIHGTVGYYKIINNKRFVWLYPEGTYDIGTHPEAYQPCPDNNNNNGLLPQSIIDGLKRNYQRDRFIPQYTIEGEMKYRVGTTFHGKVNKVTTTIAVSAQDMRLTGIYRWLIPRGWLSDFERIMESYKGTGKETFINELYKRVKVGALVTTSAKYNVVSDYEHGRYQNKVVAPDYTVNAINGKNYFFIQKANLSNPEEDYLGYKREGLTAQEFIDCYLVDDNGEPIIPWFDFLDYRKAKYTASDGSVVGYQQRYQRQTVTTTSYIHGGKPYKLLSFANNYNGKPFKYNGREVVFPEVYPNFGMAVSRLYNVEKPVENGDYHDEHYLVRYAVKYGYALTANYSEMTEKMEPDALKHWKKKGFDPEMFAYPSIGTEHDGVSKVRVIFSGDGKSITINGHWKIAGKYTKGVQRGLISKDQIKFLTYCPEQIVIADDRLRESDAHVQFFMNNRDELKVHNAYRMAYKMCLDGNELELEDIHDDVEIEYLKPVLKNVNFAWSRFAVTYKNVDPRYFGKKSKNSLKQRLTVENKTHSNELFISKIKDFSLEEPYSPNGKTTTEAEVAIPFIDIPIMNGQNWRISKDIPINNGRSEDQIVPELHDETTYLYTITTDEHLLKYHNTIIKITSELFTIDEFGCENTIRKDEYHAQMRIYRPITFRVNQEVPGYEQYLEDYDFNDDPMTPKTVLVEIDGIELNRLEGIGLNYSMDFHYGNNQKVTYDGDFRFWNIANNQFQIPEYHNGTLVSEPTIIYSDGLKHLIKFKRYPTVTSSWDLHYFPKCGSNLEYQLKLPFFGESVNSEYTIPKFYFNDSDQDIRIDYRWWMSFPDSWFDERNAAPKLIAPQLSYWLKNTNNISNYELPANRLWGSKVLQFTVERMNDKGNSPQITDLEYTQGERKITIQFENFPLSSQNYQCLNPVLLAHYYKNGHQIVEKEIPLYPLRTNPKYDWPNQELEGLSKREIDTMSFYTKAEDHEGFTLPVPIMYDDERLVVGTDKYDYVEYGLKFYHTPKPRQDHPLDQYLYVIYRDDNEEEIIFNRYKCRKSTDEDVKGKVIKSLYVNKPTDPSYKTNNGNPYLNPVDLKFQLDKNYIWNKSIILTYSNPSKGLFETTTIDRIGEGSGVFGTVFFNLFKDYQNIKFNIPYGKYTFDNQDNVHTYIDFDNQELFDQYGGDATFTVDFKVADQIYQTVKLNIKSRLKKRDVIIKVNETMSNDSFNNLYSDRYFVFNFENIELNEIIEVPFNFQLIDTSDDKVVRNYPFRINPHHASVEILGNEINVKTKIREITLRVNKFSRKHDFFKGLEHDSDFYYHSSNNSGQRYELNGNYLNFRYENLRSDKLVNPDKLYSQFSIDNISTMKTFPLKAKINSIKWGGNSFTYLRRSSKPKWYDATLPEQQRFEKMIPSRSATFKVLQSRLDRFNQFKYQLQLHEVPKGMDLKNSYVSIKRIYMDNHGNISTTYTDLVRLDQLPVDPKYNPNASEYAYTETVTESVERYYFTPTTLLEMPRADTNRTNPQVDVRNDTFDLGIYKFYLVYRMDTVDNLKELPIKLKQSDGTYIEDGLIDEYELV